MTAVLPLVDQFALGLDAPICLTWELTYACNLACVHCLSSSGKRDPNELTTQQCEAVIDELQRMKVFYVNIGGGEPTVRPDFWHLLDYAVAHQVGVKFSTNGIMIDKEKAARIAATDYVDVQISLDGATAEVNDAVRGAGSYPTALRALGNLAEAGFKDAKISVVVTRHNVSQLDEFKALADRFGATLRLTRLRPSGRGADVWDELHPTAAQQRVLYDWLVLAGEGVLTGDSFFHLAGFGEPLPGLNLCGAGRVVCLIDPVGDVYACPFAIHSEFLAGNLLRDGGSTRCGASRRSLRTCADHRRAARVPSARTSTPAAVAVWRRSSSPDCRLTDRTPSASSVTASRPSPAATSWPCPNPMATTPMLARCAASPPSPVPPVDRCRCRSGTARTAVVTRAHWSVCNCHRGPEWYGRYCSDRSRCPCGPTGTLAGAVRPARDQPGPGPRDQ